MIDWENLPVLGSPKRRSTDINDRERLARKKMAQRGGHLSGKNHSTGKRLHAIRKAKKMRIAKRLTEIERERTAFLEAAKAYWLGEADGHP